MYTYHFQEWLIFFCFYCVFGWCFESVYVSLVSRRPVNRGFLKGPWLPLYGSGAVVVLWLTLPFRTHPFMVYLVGALGATALEYVTGEAMVRLFKVRYWDYSNQKFQYKGHICLSSSIVWGFLSLLMVYVVHERVALLVFRIPGEIRLVLAFTVAICMACDTGAAFRRAMDLREVLLQAEQIRMELERRAAEKKRLFDAAAVFTKAAVEESIENRKEALLQSKDRIASRTASVLETAQLEERLEQLRERMSRIGERPLLQSPRARFMTLFDDTGDIRERIRKRKKKS